VAEKKAAFDWRRLPLRLRNITRRMRMGAARKEVSEREWRSRGGDDWVTGYWNDTQSPRRDSIIEALRRTFEAPASVLDVGCNAGPMLRRVAAEFPGCQLVGFDINAAAIAGARQRFGELGLVADLSVGSFYDVLPAIASGSVDIVISSFALAYVPPSHLPAVLSDVIRIAVRGIVMAEPHAMDDVRAPGVLTVPWYDWRHDYSAVLTNLGVNRNRIAVLDLPEPGSADAGLLIADLR
jgi:SAM-dependent methyltransferase